MVGDVVQATVEDTVPSSWHSAGSSSVRIKKPVIGRPSPVRQARPRSRPSGAGVRPARATIGRPLGATGGAASRRAVYRPVKRAMDVFGSLFLLITLSPVMLVVALLVKLTSPGPVIYRQRRLTQGGRVFELLKFRSMRQDAEAGTGAVWAAKNDPRVTPIGHVLRKYRLDELPQLWNVLRGDMSLIGPRPERPEIAAELERTFPSFRRRLEVPAGLSGLAQVGWEYCSSVESYRRKFALDLVYIKNQCLLLDLRIALRTVVVLLSGHGSR